MEKLVTAFEWRFIRPGFWGTWAGLGVLWLFSFLPRRVYHPLAGGLGLLAMRLNKKRCRIAQTNLELCLPQLSAEARSELLRDNFRLAGICLLDLGVLWLRGSRRLEKYFRIEGKQHLEAARTSGRPIILLTGHTMALDHGAMALAIQYAAQGVKAVSMYKPQKNDLIAWLMYRSRTHLGVSIYAREEGLRPVVRDVRKGAAFYYLPDEDLGPEESIFVSFFGVQKATVPALGTLARLTNAQVIPCIAHYDEQDARYVVHALPPLANFPTGDREQDARLMNEALEQMILLDPKQYMWVYKLFRTRPEGEQAFY
jgi:Kdo2-lipid IVA lauroyltransferase/acyltransferase